MFAQLLPQRHLERILAFCAPKSRGAAKLQHHHLIHGLVFHIVAGVGTLAEHLNRMFGICISDSALSQRRANLPWQVFESIMREALVPRAQPDQHPEAFHKGLRLCGLDGSLFSVSNAPPIKRTARKARTRRQNAAFAKVGLATMMELGTHCPIGAAIAEAGESEMALARQLVERLPPKSLLIADRYYGLGAFITALLERHTQGDRHFLLRAKSNLSCRLIESYPDGSALVEIGKGESRRLVREVRARVRRGSKGWSDVRLWTSLLDWREHPAQKLLELYSRRWEHEVAYKEMKVDMRSSPLLQSHTLHTAAQEVAALVLAYAVLADQRLRAGLAGEQPVLRISFLKTLHWVRGLWDLLEIGEDLLSRRQIRELVARTLAKIAAKAIAPRRKRSCPRAVRQPVSGRPRLLQNTYEKGPVEYQLLPIPTS